MKGDPLRNWYCDSIRDTHHLMDGDVMIFKMCLKMEPPKKHLNRYPSFLLGVSVLEFVVYNVLT